MFERDVEVSMIRSHAKNGRYEKIIRGKIKRGNPRSNYDRVSKWTLFN